VRYIVFLLALAIAAGSCALGLLAYVDVDRDRDLIKQEDQRIAKVSAIKQDLPDPAKVEQRLVQDKANVLDLERQLQGLVFFFAGALLAGLAGFCAVGRRKYIALLLLAAVGVPLFLFRPTIDISMFLLHGWFPSMPPASRSYPMDWRDYLLVGTAAAVVVGVLFCLFIRAARPAPASDEE
jgi:hypothetical protein